MEKHTQADTQRGFVLMQIPVDSILPDLNQPRKTFSDGSIKELAESIKEKGLLQPIAVRVVDGETVLVFGERRLRAYQYLCETEEGEKWKEIPARMYNIPDEEVSDIQLIENSHREDVHFIEEAEIFGQKVQEGKTPEEIAGRIGKSVRYVKERIWLNYMDPKWVPVARQNLITFNECLELSSLSPEEQLEIYKDSNAKEAIKDGREIGLDWYLRQSKQILNHVKWDLDKDFPGLGKCNGCAYNSSTGVLFHNEGEKMVCSNKKCFEEKTNRHKQDMYDIAAEMEDVVYVDAMHYRSREEAKEIAEKLGISKLTKNENVVVIDIPIVESVEEIKEQNGRLSNEAALKRHEKMKKQRDALIQECEKQAEEGIVKKALLVGGNRDGEIVYVKPVTKSKTADSETTEETKETIEEKIVKYKERLKRVKEIETNRAHDEIIDAVSKKILLSPKETEHDQALLVYLLTHFLQWNEKKEIDKYISLPEPKGGHGYDFEYFEKLAQVSHEDIMAITRIVLYERCKAKNREVGTNETAMYLLAKIAMVDLGGIEKKKDDILAEKEGRITEKINELRKHKRKIQDTTKQV